MASMVFDMIVDKLLGTYLCIGERKLDFSSGTLTMKNVMVREDVLDSLSLPVALRGGEIGELEVHVPWTKLKTESVVIKINKLSLLLSPVSEAEWDEVAERDRVAACKERTLQRLRKQLADGKPAYTVFADSVRDQLAPRPATPRASACASACNPVSRATAANPCATACGPV